jgi:DNA-binding CsgD family transcriptional regulator
VFPVGGDPTPHAGSRAPLRPNCAGSDRVAAAAGLPDPFGIDRLIEAGRLPEAISLAHQALIIDDRAPEARARLRLTLSSLLFLSGRVDESMDQASAVLTEPGLPGSLYAGAELVRLRWLVAIGDSQAARHHAESVLAGANWVGADMALSGAFCTLGLLAWDEGRVTEALRWMRVAVQRADQGFAEGRQTNPRLHMAFMLNVLGGFEIALDMLTAAETQIRRSKQTEWLASVPAARARLMLNWGRTDEAAAEAHSAIHLCEELGTRPFASTAMNVLAMVALRNGDVEGAAALLNDVRAAPPPAGILGWASHTWARIEIEEAQVGSSRPLALLNSHLANQVAVNRLLLEDPCGGAWWVRAALAAGDRTSAERVTARIEALALSNPEISTLSAEYQHARGLFDRRGDLLRNAAALHKSARARASATEDLAESLSSRDRGASLIEYEHATSLYHQAGAVRDANRVARRRRQKADRPVSGWASLTSTEQRVALVVAEGLTNAQVGARLFLSRHTVDFHLRQVFRKLGINSRVELVRVVIADDIDPPPFRRPPPWRAIKGRNEDPARID